MESGTRTIPDGAARERLHQHRTRRAAVAVALLAATYLALAYLILPLLWRHYEHQPALESAPKTTWTSFNLPGDPLNVALIGTEDEVVHCLLQAGWHPADPVTFRTSLRIAKSVVFDRAYPDAPVSSLYLWNRKQDLAFEKEAGKSAMRRHHVRFWENRELNPDGRPLWLGAATFDRSVGFSHRTGQITHHIEADVDAERDALFEDLKKTGELTKISQVTGVGATLNGHNGGGDRYYTDGELTVGVIAPDNSLQETPPQEPASPIAVRLKNRVWAYLRSWLR